MVRTASIATLRSADAGAQPRSAPRAARLRLNLRRLRLASGLILFGYVLTHLLNHALGNVSLDAMEDGLDLVTAVWLNPVGLTLLYGALVVHLLLGLQALYAARFFHWRPSETLQLVSGLLIPPLLISHIVGTRVSFVTEGLDKGYAQELYAFWIASPILGLMQVTVLVVAWIHGCMGLYFWLRLKTGFDRVAPWLLALAVLVPVLSLLGFAQGGRMVLTLAQDPAWRAAALQPVHVGLPDQVARLAAVRDGLLGTYAGLVAAVIAPAARGRSPRSSAARSGSATRTGGWCGCPAARACWRRAGATGSPCQRLRRPRAVLDLPDPGDGRQRRRAGARPHRAGGAGAHRRRSGVRLACQFRPETDMAVVPLLPPQPRMRQADLLDRAQSGEERFIVAMFVDLRGSTRLAEERLPYDTVFIINRFLGAVGDAVREAGGSTNQFLGDGLLALFGLETEPEQAARDALRAIDGIADAVETLNRLLAEDLEHILRYGVGVHAGPAIVGEMGDATDARFTALGDTVNVASRLQGLTKTLGCVAVVSETVYRAARVAPAEIRDVAVDGRSEAVRVSTLGSF